MSEPILLNAALALMGMLLVAALGVLWKLQLKVTEMHALLSNEEFGVVTLLKELQEEVAEIAKRVGALERRRG